MSRVSHPSSKSRQAVGSPPRPEADIGRLLKNMHQSARQAIDESLRRQRIDMSFAHLVTLMALDLEPGLPGAELARRSFVTAQTMNTILHRLEGEAAIERRPHPGNQRADSWYITKMGLARLKRARVIAEGVWTQMFASFKDQEVAQLHRLLERCLAGLEQQLVTIRATSSANRKAAKKTVRRTKAT